MSKDYASELASVWADRIDYDRITPYVAIEGAVREALAEAGDVACEELDGRGVDGTIKRYVVEVIRARGAKP